jgi:hypothetical protein
MNRNALGGIVALSLIVTALMLGYIFVARTSSGYRMEHFSSTMAFFEERRDALERQRGLLQESAAALEEQSALLKKRVGQIDAEIENMSTRLKAERQDARTPFYSWRSFHFTTSSGLTVIAFLVFIWLLYLAVRKRETDGAAIPPSESPGPGSVLEEEFPPAVEEPPGEETPSEDSSASLPEESGEGGEVSGTEEDAAGEAGGDEPAGGPVKEQEKD